MDTKRITLVVGVAAALSLTFTGVALATVTPGPNTAQCLQLTQIAERDAAAATLADSAVTKNIADVKTASDALTKAQAKVNPPATKAELDALQGALTTQEAQLKLAKEAQTKAHEVLLKAVKARNEACAPPVTPTTTPVPTTVPPTTTATPPPTTTVVVPPPVVVQQPVILAPQYITVPNVTSGVNTGDGSLA